MKITKTIKVPTGEIYVAQGEKGLLEFLTVGDYGKDANIKADFLGITRELNGVPNGKPMPLTEKWVITISTQYGCSMGCKFCLPPSECVMMADYTYKPIADIEIGDCVMANANVKENAHSPIKKYASLTSCNAGVVGLIRRVYHGDMYKIITESGKTINCTAGHLLAVKYKTRYLFQEAKNLAVGDYLITNRHSPDKTFSNQWKLGWCVGFMEGDGCYTSSDCPRWQIAQNDKRLIQLFKDFLAEFDIKTSNVWINGEHCHMCALQGQQIDHLAQLCKNIDDEFRRGYIAGFWDAEGFSFRNNQTTRVCNTDLGLINKCRAYLKELGYECSGVYESNHNSQKIIYTLNIKVSRDEFNAVFRPRHNKSQYLGESKSKSFSRLEKVTVIEKYRYDGIVYNIETSEHSYYAGDILNHNCDVPKVGAGRNATLADLRDQILTAIRQHPEVKHTKRLNIHYARMGEPTWNNNVLINALYLHDIVKPYIGDSLIHPVVSTMLPKHNRELVSFLLTWAKMVKNGVFNGDAGLQFSINSTDDKQREYLFSGNSLTLEEIAEIGRELPMPLGRKYALNFALADDSIIDGKRLRELFDPDKFMCKITPLHRTASCEQNHIATTDGYELFTPYKAVEEDLKAHGFDVIVFVPSYDEDNGLITCGNAILSGKLPTSEYEIIENND